MEVPELKKNLSWLDQHLEEVIIIILLGLMVIIMGIQVFMRYVLAKSLPWPEELTRYLFIWFVFLGISYGIRYNIHIKVDIIETVFPKVKPFLIVIQDLLFLTFCIMMIRPSINGVNMMIRTGQTSPAMNLPMCFVYLSLLMGFCLAIIRLVQKYLLILFRRFGRGNILSKGGNEG